MLVVDSAGLVLSTACNAAATAKLAVSIRSALCCNKLNLPNVISDACRFDCSCAGLLFVDCLSGCLLILCKDFKELLTFASLSLTEQQAIVCKEEVGDTDTIPATLNAFYLLVVTAFLIIEDSPSAQNKKR